MYATLFGLLSVVLYSSASVMTELLLKKHKDMDIWQQNIWLSLCAFFYVAM